MTQLTNQEGTIRKFETVGQMFKQKLMRAFFLAMFAASFIAIPATYLAWKNYSYHIARDNFAYDWQVGSVAGLIAGCVEIFLVVILSTLITQTLRVLYNWKVAKVYVIDSKDSGANESEGVDDLWDRFL